MVLISILHRLKDKYGYQIATATIVDPVAPLKD
jgi:hypothetical protein